MLGARLLPVAVVKLHDGDLHAVGWGEGPCALVTPVKPIRVGVGLKIFKKVVILNTLIMFFLGMCYYVRFQS